MTLQEVKEIKDSGKKKFGKFLFNNISHLYNEGYSHASVAKYLLKADIKVTVKDLVYYKAKYSSTLNKVAIQEIKLTGINETNTKEKTAETYDRDWIEKMLDTSDIPPKISKF